MSRPILDSNSTATQASDTQVPSAWRRFLLVATLVPALATLTAIALQWWWLDELPDPAATHFSGSTPDGFGPPWTYPVMTAAVSVALIAMTAAFGWYAARSGSWNTGIRFLGAFCSAVVLLLLVGLTGTVSSQRGLVDATQASDPVWHLAAGLGIGAVYGFLAWLIQPNVVTKPAGLREAQAQPLSATQKLVWVQSTSLGGKAQVALTLAIGTVLALAVSMTLWGDATGARVLWGTLLLVVVATLATSKFRVRIDDSGLHVHSALGLPRWRIGLSEIDAVRSVEVNPLRDFGGWGVRWQPGNGVGIVTRPGPALQVEYRSGKRLTVTVDDSARASDVLASLLERSD